MSRLATIPHAPVKRLRRRGGADSWSYEDLAPGSWVSLAGARAIYVKEPVDAKPVVVIELPDDVIWEFTLEDVETAQKHADQFAIRAGR